MTMQEIALNRIAKALEDLSENGIVAHIKFPDDMDKFVTDLPAMKISDSIRGLVNAICSKSEPIKITYTPRKPEEITLETNINDVSFSNRVKNCLNRDGRFITMQKLLDAYCASTKGTLENYEIPLLLTVRNLGRKGLQEIEETLTKHHFI